MVLARDTDDSVSSDSGPREVDPLEGVALGAGSPTLESPDDAAVEGASTDVASTDLEPAGAGPAVSLAASSSTGSGGVEAASAASRR